jgi:hypothetical protein
MPVINKLMNKKTFFNQSGIAQVAVLLLLVGGIVLGSYLVRERTNLIPHAQEVEAGYCENGWEFKGGDAGNNSNWENNGCGLENQQEHITQIEENDRIYCERECGSVNSCEGYLGNKRCKQTNDGGGGNISSGDNRCEQPKYYCDFNKDPNGRRIFKTGAYFTDDPSDPLYGERDQNGCVYDFQDKGNCQGDEEVIGTAPEGWGKNGEQNTGKLNSCPDNGLEYCEGGKTIVKKNGRPNDSGSCDYDFEDRGQTAECSGKDNGTVIKAGQGTQDQQLACQETDKVNTYYDTKVLTNLAYYTAIIKGTPELCVKADLGQSPHLYAHSQDDPDNERRLFMCSGKDGSIKWRVVSADGNSLVPTQEEFSTDINQEQLQKAKGAASI